MIQNKDLYNIQNRAFNLFIFLSYLTYALILLGITTTAPKYISDLDYWVSIYIGFFMIIRFNPIRNKIVFTELDRKIAFSAGLFILTTVLINKIVANYLGVFKK